MSSEVHTHLKRLPLHEKHVEKGGRFGAFGVWEVPLYYSSILEEHEAVRKSCGIFDISHMGEFYFEGPEAQPFLEDLLPRSVTRLSPGSALYAPLLNEQGKILDDIIVYKCGTEKFLMIVNADNVEKDFAWISDRAPRALVCKNGSEATGLLAIQGPKSPAVVQKVFPKALVSSLKYYHFTEWEDGMIARTGYTGEDGFEIMVSKERLAEVWDRLFESGSEEGLRPAGFGARDTLRLEAGMPLYGHEMDEKTSPLELFIDWAVDFGKGRFAGREALLKEKEKGISRRLVGFKMTDRGIPRPGYEIRKRGIPAGTVTSGSFSPTLQMNLGMGFVSIQEAVPGNEIEVVVRGKALKAEIVPLPFYQRKKL